MHVLVTYKNSDTGELMTRPASMRQLRNLEAQVAEKGTLDRIGNWVFQRYEIVREGIGGPRAYATKSAHLR